MHALAVVSRKHRALTALITVVITVIFVAILGSLARGRDGPAVVVAARGRG
ncbi:hypothetical protein [Cryobacterium fucosi]|uniref:hypothetical protein n=1 Tax=Cryobacterium fucosi TaxID=1259157 RepID=UPI00141BCE9F|nr:hypothetical protein [Cryobacterium fucosi]